jgi:plastocyanin
VAVGSLGSKERLYRNDGGMVFTNTSTDIQAQNDPSLDCTFADLDNDGDYDFITSQGEGGGAGSWTNKVYINSGPADTTSPRLMDFVPVGDLTSNLGPWVGKAKIQDSVIDDGRNWVDGVAHYAVVDGVAPAVIGISAMGFSPSNVNILPGGSVIFMNASGITQSVTSASAPYTFDSSTLVSGENYQLHLVQPGVYQIVSTPTGFTCTVTVTGADQEVAMNYSGGGIYRAAMTGDATSPSAVLVYEYEFEDWAGNRMVTLVQTEGHAGGSVGTGFCFGDGTATACPCGNAGAAGAGCGNSANANGALLSGTGNSTTAADSVTLLATGCPPNKPGVFFQGAMQGQSGNGVVFGDGLLCAAGMIVRLQTVFSDGSGVAASSVVVSLTGGVAPGDVRTYQFWYRDSAGASCGNGFNTTNGLQITWN